MQGSFTDFHGVEKIIDLDLLKVIVQGRSAVRKGWSGMLVYCPTYKTLIELRSSPPSVRGDSLDEASEVDKIYAMENYDVTEEKLKNYFP